MKRMLILVLSVSMLLLCAACGSGPAQETAQPSPSAAPTAAPTPTPEVTPTPPRPFWIT